LKHILYLTWGEQISLNGLVGNQVFNLLSRLAALDKNLKISVVAGVPYFSRERFLSLRKLKVKHGSIRVYLKEAGISLVVWPVLVLPRIFYSRFYLNWLYYIFALLFLKHYVQRNQVDLIHCRSYHAANLALQARRKYKLPVKIIFDPRGLFPEEGVFVGSFSADSKSYRAWKLRERQILKECNLIVSVSTSMTEHYSGLTDINLIETIYTSVDTKLFFKDPVSGGDARTALGLLPDEKVLIYVGSIATEGWHRVDTLVQLFQAFKEIFGKARLLLVTQSWHEPLREQLGNCGLQDSEYLLTESAGASETNYYLNAADYACMPYRKNQSNLDTLIGSTVLATKTGEYFAAGLPLLVNENAGEAAMLVEKYKLGIVYKVDKEEIIGEALKKVDLAYDKVSRNCIKVAHSYFDAEKAARKYLGLYETLLKDRK
jgi:glycosyltransferase involved in cell wall biosynthesis